MYCGDLNTEPGDLAHLVLTQKYQLNDTQGIRLTDFSFFSKPKPNYCLKSCHLVDWKFS